MDQKPNENSIVLFQQGKQMNLFDGIDERTLQYGSAENRIAQEDCQEKGHWRADRCAQLQPQDQRQEKGQAVEDADQCHA